MAKNVFSDLTSTTNNNMGVASATPDTEDKKNKVLGTVGKVMQNSMIPVLQAGGAALSSYVDAKTLGDQAGKGKASDLLVNFKAGAYGTLENFSDTVIGGAASILGNITNNQKIKDYATKVMSNDLVDMKKIAENNYDYSKGWQNAMELSQGLGNLATQIGVGVATGGLGKIGASLASSAFIGTSAMGGGVKEALNDTGTLGGKEWGYGALNGALEFGTEALTAGIGKVGVGTAKAVNTMIGKSAVKELTSNGIKGIAKELASDFISEAIEEGLSEGLNPYLKRATYDPDAQNATLNEIGHAALMGGLVGLIGAGSTTAISTSMNIASGNNILNRGKTDAVLELSKQLSEYDKITGSSKPYLENITRTYNELVESMNNTNGEIKTLSQKSKLGYLAKMNAVTAIMPSVELGAEQVVRNAKAIAEAYNKQGLKDSNGNPIIVTAEELTNGIDFTSDETISESISKKIASDERFATISAMQGTEQAKLMKEYQDYKKSEEDALLSEFIGEMDLSKLTENERKAMLEAFGAGKDGNVDEFMLRKNLKQMIDDGIFKTANDIGNLVNAAMSNPKLVSKWKNLETENGIYKADDNIYVIKLDDGYRIVIPSRDLVYRPFTDVNAVKNVIEGIKKTDMANETAKNVRGDKVENVENAIKNDEMPLSDEEIDKIVSDKSNPDKNMLQKEKAMNREDGKVYSRASVERLIKDLKNGIFDGNVIIESDIKGKNKKEAIEYLFNRLNSNLSEAEQKKAADVLARYIVNNSYVDILTEDNELFGNIDLSSRDIQVQKISAEVMRLFREGGENSKVNKLNSAIDTLMSRLAGLEGENRVLVEKSKLYNTISREAVKMRSEVGKKTATSIKDSTFDSILKQLGSATYNGNFSEKKFKTALNAVLKWFNENNKILKSVYGETDPTPDANGNDVTKANIPSALIQTLEYLKASCFEYTLDSDGDPVFKLDESGNPIPNRRKMNNTDYKAVLRVYRAVEFVKNNYNKAEINGRKVEIETASNSGAQLIRDFGAKMDFFGNKHGYITGIIDPSAVIGMIEGYKSDGVLSAMFNDIKKAETATRSDYINLTRKLDDFGKKSREHRKYIRNFKKKTVNFKGEMITKAQYLSLYCTSKREQAKLGLVKGGVRFSTNGKVVLIDGTVEALTDTISGEQTYKVNITENFNLSALDKEYLSIIDELFEKSKDMKIKTDIELFGFTNAEDGYYFPIARSSKDLAKRMTTVRTSMSMTADAFSQSFNINVKKNAMNPLFIGSVDGIARNHANGMSIYSNMAKPLMTFDKVYNFNFGSTEAPDTLRQAVLDNWTSTVKTNLKGESDGQIFRADKYIENLMLDIQNARPNITDSADSGLLKYVKGAAAMFALGGNVGVALGQFASYPMALQYFDLGTVTKALTRKINLAEMDKWSPYSMARAYEGETVLADSGIAAFDGLSNATRTFAKVMYSGITAMDRFTISRIWECAKLKAEKEGLTVGTEEYYKRAAEIQEEVCRKTQPNYSNSERSEWMRSNNIFKNMSTMFTSTPLKMISRLTEDMVKVSLAKQNGGNVKAELKRAFNTLGVVTFSTVMLISIKKAVKLFLKQDKDENAGDTAKNIVEDSLFSMIGMLPGFNQIINATVKGYDMSDFSMAAFESIVKDIYSLSENVTGWLKGDLDDSALVKATMSLIDATGRFTGIPTRNMIKTFQGLLDRFAPDLGYGFSDFRLAMNYGKDLTEALSANDSLLADTIITKAMEGRLGNSSGAEAKNEITRLYELGYSDVLPRAIRNKISYTDDSGEKHEIILDRKQKKAFKKTYSQANDVIDNIVTAKAFKTLSDEAKAKAIKSVYEGYYSKALNEISGKEMNKYALLIGTMDSDKLALGLTGISTANSVKGADGRTVSGSKKANAIKYLNSINMTDGERLFLLTYSGYSLKDNDYKGMSRTWQMAKLYMYIMNLDVDNNTRIYLADKCGLEVINGRIKRPSGTVIKLKMTV